MKYINLTVLMSVTWLARRPTRPRGRIQGLYKYLHRPYNPPPSSRTRPLPIVVTMVLEKKKLCPKDQLGSLVTFLAAETPRLLAWMMSTISFSKSSSAEKQREAVLAHTLWTLGIFETLQKRYMSGNNELRNTTKTKKYGMQNTKNTKH